MYVTLDKFHVCLTATQKSRSQNLPFWATYENITTPVRQRDDLANYSCPFLCGGAAEAELALAGAPLLPPLLSWLSILVCSCFTNSSSSACRHAKGEQEVEKELKKNQADETKIIQTKGSLSVAGKLHELMMKMNG